MRNVHADADVGMTLLRHVPSCLGSGTAGACVHSRGTPAARPANAAIRMVTVDADWPEPTLLAWLYCGFEACTQDPAPCTFPTHAKCYAHDPSISPLPPGPPPAAAPRQVPQARVGHHRGVLACQPCGPAQRGRGPPGAAARHPGDAAHVKVHVAVRGVAGPGAAGSTRRPRAGGLGMPIQRGR